MSVTIWLINYSANSRRGRDPLLLSSRIFSFLTVIAWAAWAALATVNDPPAIIRGRVPIAINQPTMITLPEAYQVGTPVPLRPGTNAGDLVASSLFANSLFATVGRFPLLLFFAFVLQRRNNC